MPDTTPVPAPEPTPNPAPAPAPGTPPAFHESFQDPTVREFVQTKGWKENEAIAKSAMNLEKMVGAPADELVRVPKGADAAVIRNVYQKLGLPESPDKYEISVPDGMPVDENYQKFAREMFHKAGVPASMAKEMVAMQNEYVAKMMTEQAEAYKVKLAAEENALKAEWGNGFERQMGLAKNAAQQLGFTGDVVDAIEEKIGFAATMKLFNGIGSKLGEDNFVAAMNSREGFHGQMTPAEAKAAYSNMMNDAGKVKALNDKQHPSHKELLEQKTQLFKIMYPDQ